MLQNEHCRRVELDIEERERPLTMLQDITFARVPYWFPNFQYKALRMNLICPFRSEPEERFPVIVWACGGAWITMEKGAHLPFLMDLARKGYIVASIEYRMSSTRHFPAQIEDVKSAIRYLRAHAEEFHIDPERIVIGGESAGGHLAALAGATGDCQEFDVGEHLEYSSRVSGVLDFYGPASFVSAPTEEPDNTAENTDEAPGPFMGPSPVEMLLGYDPAAHPEEAERAAALSYINEKTPPYFIIHGTADGMVPIDGSRRLAERLQEKGGSYEMIEVKDAGHADPRIYQEETIEEMAAFLERIFTTVAQRAPFHIHRTVQRAVSRPMITMVENIPYAQTPYWFPFYDYKDLNLDLLLPMEWDAAKRHPLLVWICGGAFRTMEKAAYLPWLSYFAKAGYVVASVQYRLSNVAPFPAPLEDVKKAIRFLRAHAAEFHIDPEQVVVGGESAGGYLAAMAGLTNDRAEYEKGECLQVSSHVQAVIDYYGPIGINHPEAGVSGREMAVPVFLAHGTGDTLVDPQISETFYGELQEAGVPVEYVVVPGAPHMGMQFYQREMAERILRFLSEAAGIVTVV